MAKRMLVDATHPEETRVVVVNGNKLEELDFEIASRKQLKGNIYLARVTRVEPSLQAAFVEYGGNRHGFLAFSEIHPDYYRIPLSDREALMAEEARFDEVAEPAGDDMADEPLAGAMPELLVADAPARAADDTVALADAAAITENAGAASADLSPAEGAAIPVETVGAVDDLVAEEEAATRRRTRPLRSYKIQEVIKRRQILLVQVTKEERGNKGAALTTYLSLPGRYCVLMPNTPRGGGISRKISNPQDRKRMKEILGDLDIPEGMAVILRTAGLERSKAEIKRDLEYLVRLWDDIREQTLQSTAPALIYEEANLIKRSIRDLYSSDIDEVLVEGEQGYQNAKDFMRMLMPSHTRKIQPYRDDTIPLFFRYQVETQIDAMHQPVVQLRSGGYIVINPTEALVAIDVNSGRATRERNIEETALRTNLEAAEEIARQLRLRDLAGLIVIDFIDMEDPRNNAAVERKVKEAMKSDRARIQLGRISPFGLLELSRQRLRPSLMETNFEHCPHCSGTGLIRSVESASLHVLRAIEEEGIRKRSSEITVHVPARVALYILNQKREALVNIEQRYGFRVYLQSDDTLIAPDLRLERIKVRQPGDEVPVAITVDRVLAQAEPVVEDVTQELEAEADIEGDAEADAEESAGAEVNGNGEANSEEARERRRRRSRRKRRRGGVEEAAEIAAEPQQTVEAAEVAEAMETDEADAEEDEDGDAEDGGLETVNGENGDATRKKRRRGKRGGRRRSRGRLDLIQTEADGTAGTGAQSEPALVRDVPGAAESDTTRMEPVDHDLTLDSAPVPAVEAAVSVPAAEAAASVEAAAVEAAAVEAAAPAEAEAPVPGSVPADDLPAVVEPAAVSGPAPAAEAAKPAKPKRPSRARKKVEAETEPAPVAVEPPPAPAPEPVKPKRPSRARKKPEVVAAPGPEPEAPVVGEPAPAAEDAKPVKPKRPSRARKAEAKPEAKAETVAETVEAPVTAVAPAPVEAPAPKRSSRRKKVVETPAAEAPAEGPAEGPVVEAVPEVSSAEAPSAEVPPAVEPAPVGTAKAEPEKAPTKPRRGWWSR